MKNVPEGKVGMEVDGQLITVDDSGDLLDNQKKLLDLAKKMGLVSEHAQDDVIYNQAVAFGNVASRIYEDYIKDMDPEILSSMQKVKDNLCPFVVNIAFSAEMFLKYLAVISSTFKRGHGLIKLYKDLPLAMRTKIDTKTIDAEKEYQIVKGKSFEEYLEHLDNAFVVWRYIHEGGLKHIEPNDALVVINVLLKVENKERDN